MTVCIVAVCGHWNWTVQVTDHMATFNSGGLSLSADSILFKANSIDHFWNAMMAGDLARGHTIIDSIRSHSGNWNHQRSYEQVVETITRAYRETVKHEITNRVLSVYSLSMEDFTRDGLKMFGAEAFADIRYRIERAQADFDCELLVSGFEGVCQPRVFGVVNPGYGVNHDDLHFWAIGSGAAIALGSLANRVQRQSMTVLETIYNVLEAKFAAERSPGVGKETCSH